MGLASAVGGLEAEGKGSEAIPDCMRLLEGAAPGFAHAAVCRDRQRASAHLLAGIRDAEHEPKRRSRLCLAPLGWGAFDGSMSHVGRRGDCHADEAVIRAIWGPRLQAAAILPRVIAPAL